MAKNKSASTKTSVKNSKQKLSIMVSVLGLLLLSVVGFVWQRNQVTQVPQAIIQNVSVNDLATAISTAGDISGNTSSDDYIILDVREQWEYDQGHVAGVTLIPLGELKARASELPQDKPIYVMCHSGRRSVTASTILKDAGKQDIRNVQGGIVAWAAANLPVEQ